MARPSGPFQSSLQVSLAAAERDEEEGNSRNQHAADSQEFTRVTQIIGNCQKAERGEHDQRRPQYFVPRHRSSQNSPSR